MTTSPSEASGYDVNDPQKIQGREEVFIEDRSLAALRLRRALDALGDGIESVLAPGAGAGRYARALARYRPDWQIVAGDLSAAAVSEATQLGGGPHYTVFNAETIPFGDQSFDGVVFFDLLEHVPHPERLLLECWRVLRPGGCLHFFVPLEAQPNTIYKLLRDNRPIPIHQWKTTHVGHIQHFREHEVVQLVWSAGFEVKHLSHSFHLIGQIHDVLDYWQRERNRGGQGFLPLAIVNLLCRGAFILTWRGSYLEDRLYDGSRFASGLHVTAHRPI